MTDHEIREGDALELLRALPDESIDAIITDPPYSSGGMFRGDRAKGTAAKYVMGGEDTKRADFQGDTRDGHGFAYWCALWLGQAFRAAKPGALCAVFCDWRQLATMTDVVQAGGWVFRGIVPWNKTEATRPQKGWFRSQCEYVIVGAKGKPALYGKPEAPCLAGFFVCPVDRGNVHQTQKPVAVMRWLAQIVPRGGLILDPFAGSGTTGVGAKLEGRRFLGFEAVPSYATIARERIDRTAAAEDITTPPFVQTYQYEPSIAEPAEAVA